MTPTTGLGYDVDISATGLGYVMDNSCNDFGVCYEQFPQQVQGTVQSIPTTYAVIFLFVFECF